MEAVAVHVADFGYEQDSAIEDVALAARWARASILITADCAASVERLARRIHAASDRAAFPFVRAAAATLPIDAAVLTGRCADLLDTARGGSLLLTDVEQMPAFVQNRLVDTFDGLQAALEPACRVRLLAGTTTALYERIADGTFAERLFYRLNIIHLVAKNGAGERDSPGGGSTGEKASLVG